MFGAPFTAVGLFDIASNRRTSGARSGAYAHSRKLHGLSGELTVWPGTADVDTQLRVSYEEHGAIMSALLAGDGDACGAAFERHILNGKRRLMDGVPPAR
jgi:DNA-binding GntR family transcriptional regulator